MREGMRQTVTSGTAQPLKDLPVEVAGKTGTSQVVKMRDSRGAVPYQYRDHALFVAFAPYDKPEIAVAVIIEHGEHGDGGQRQAQ